MSFHSSFQKLQRSLGLFPTTKNILFFSHSKSTGGPGTGTSGSNDNNSIGSYIPNKYQYTDSAVNMSSMFFSCPRACLHSHPQVTNRLCLPLLSQSLNLSSSHHQLHNKKVKSTLAARNGNSGTAVKPNIHLFEDVKEKKLSVCERYCVNDTSESTYSRSEYSEHLSYNRSDLNYLKDKTATHSFFQSIESHPDTSNFLLFAASDNNNESDERKGPSQEQLDQAQEQVTVLVKDLLKGVTLSPILHPELIFENNLQGTNKVTSGIRKYTWEIAKLRWKIHIQNTQASIDVMNVTVMEQTGVIRVHWRLTGVSQFDWLKFWIKSSEKDESIEAFSYFHIGKDGLVHKLRIDRSLPDDNGETLSELKVKLNKMLNPSGGKPAVMCV